MPFNCFTSSAHDSLPRHYTPHSAQRKLGTATSATSSSSTAHRPPYSTAALPPLQASTRRRRSVHRLGSGSSASGESLDKARIGSPVGFKHLAHGGAGAEWAARTARETYAPPAIDLLAPSPSLPSSTSNRAPRPVRRKSLDASLALQPHPSPLHDLRHARQPSSSAPSSPTRAHPSPSPRADAPPRPRPKSTLPPPSRKPAPQITPSVIRAAGGVERVRESGGVPSRLFRAGGGGGGGGGVEERVEERVDEQERGQGKELEQKQEQERERQEEGAQVLEGWFTPSEIRAVGAAMALSSSSSSTGDGAAPHERVQEEADDDDERAPYETDTARAFRGAMREVEEALRVEEGVGLVRAG
ncbi:hypothetical protein JCM8208_005296 [Rhodotorula glutinis]